MNQSEQRHLLIRLGNWHVNRGHALHKLRVAIHITLLVVAIAETSHLLRPHFAVTGILALTVSSIFLHYRMRVHHAAARLSRIRMLLCDSMPMTDAECDSDYFFAKHSRLLAKLPPWPADSASYYSSKQPPGQQRLRENMAETLFFSSHLYREAQRHLDSWLALPTLAAFCILLLAPFLDPTSIIDIDRWLILIVVLYNEVEIVSKRFEYARASSECSALLELLREPAPTNTRLMFIANTYASISASAPPGHPALYRSVRKHLNELWATQRRHYE